LLRFTLTVAFVVIAAVAMLAFGLNKYGQFDVSVATENDIAERYRLVCGAYAVLILDKSKIPEELWALVPLAAKYGHGNSILTRDCISKMSATESGNLVGLVDTHRLAIDRWLLRFPEQFPAAETLAFRELISIRKQLRPGTASDKAA
jgi:hypothetical protein